MQNIKKYFMTLALLLTAVTGAWATEPRVINSEIDFESLKVGDILVEGFSMTGPNSVRFYFNAGRAKKGETLLNEDVSFYRMYISSVGTNAVITLSADAGDAAGTYTPIDENGQVVNAWIVTSTNESGNSDFHLSGYKYVAPTAEPAIDVKWDAATKTGTFEMPAFDVEIAPIYAPVAQWAKVENVDQLPTAIEGIYTGTTDAIIKAGTVAKIGETENLQGTLMYAVGTSATEQPALTAFSATLPTAKDITTAGDVYVWYYIKGADTPEGETATEKNTFNDSEICAEPLKVKVLSNKFDIQFKAANDNTIEAGKATVTVGGTAATVTEGKLESVKMGSEVKMTAKEGYKFRKVEVKKKAEAKPLANATTEDIGKVVCAAGHLHDAKTAVPDGCTAVGILGKVTETGHGLILALKDAKMQTWNTINSWTSVTAYAGTTLKVLPNDAARGTNLTSYTTLGSTTVSDWAVAQKSDYEAIFTNLGSTVHDSDGYTYDGNVNAYITTGVGGTAISGDYWSTTEKNGDAAWLFVSQYWRGYDKPNDFNVRPVLGF